MSVSLVSWMVFWWLVFDFLGWLRERVGRKMEAKGMMMMMMLTLMFTIQGTTWKAK